MSQDKPNADNIVSLEREQFKSRFRAISLSLFISIVLMAAKFYAYRLTGSSAILSDALESIINVVASAFALGSVFLASIPPDESHPYGHGKIEYFSAGFEGALIILAATGIFKTGWSHIFHPQQLLQLEEGLLILLGASLINLLLGIKLIRVGRLTRSIALIADGKHVLTDVYTSVGVLLGLLLVHLTGWYWMDGVIACSVGINILVSGGNLLRESIAGLMDASEPDLLEDISTLLAEHRKDIWTDVHQLRAWRSGNLIHIDFHLILPREFSLEQAHCEGKEIEYLINAHFQGNTSVLIHLDPCTEPDCPLCSLDRCKRRSQDLKKLIYWTRETLILQGSAGERFRNGNSLKNRH